MNCRRGLTCVQADNIFGPEDLQRDLGDRVGGGVGNRIRTV